MKKVQLSRKKSSVVNDVKQSQIKITSYFTKAPKPDLSNINKVALDLKSVSQISSIDKKRKERDDTLEEKLYTNIKKKCTADICIAEPISVKSTKDSILSSAVKDTTDTSINFKENKSVYQDVSTYKHNKKETSNCNNAYILKELQNQHTVAQKSAVLPVNTYICSKTKSPDSKQVQSKDSFEEFFAIKEDDFDDFFDQEYINAQIDFSTLQRCKIMEVKEEQRVMILTVQHIESEVIETVTCSGIWKDVQVKVDDIVTIQAEKKSQRWIIDNHRGYLITQPDKLISGTTITSGLFCSRRAVLAERFKKIESLPCPNADYSVMTIGSLVHQWLQKALRENVHALSDVVKLLDNMLQLRDTIDYLYASEMSLDDCRKRMMEYAPKIFQFIQHYIRGNKQSRINDLKDNFQGSICNIQDIEENICIPQLGIKGRIDVTAEVSINSRRKIMPLEVKTGRASYSLEHKAQVILYFMMMGLRDEEVDTGLLLYLKENSMQEIKSSYYEKRDLLILRNTLTYYFTKQSEDPSLSADFAESGTLKAMELPEPINHPTACSRCPYQVVCCAYLAKDPNVNLPPLHPLTTLIKKLLNEFESSHLDYVIRWVGLLQLMQSFDGDNGSLSNLWTMSPEKREAKRICISNLKVVGKVVERDDRYQHVFARADIKGETTEDGAFSNVFAVNDYVTVSTDTRINITTGSILQISNDTISVLLDKDVMRREDTDCAIFHIDKYSFTGSVFTFDYANVVGLLSTEKANARLRRIVIDRTPATFAKSLPRSTVSAGTEMMRDLNEDQQRAVLRAVAAEEYVLVKGMPGTGKTQTLVVLVELLLKLDFTVLITAHTHSAVDNVLLKLLDRNIDFLRLGATKQVHPLLTCKTEEYATKCCDTPEKLEMLYNDKRVVGVTCYGAYHPLLRRRSFDVCVVDESTQVTQPTVLRPLYSARRFVLVGDPNQLPPVVKSRTAVKLGADESLFVRLDSENNTVNLTKQYRMNRRIMKLANDTAYRGKLMPSNKQVENATLICAHAEVLSSCEAWVRRTLSRQLDDSVMVLDTGSTRDFNVNESYGKSVTSDQMYSNLWEAAIIIRLVRVLKEAGVYARNIGIIAPYNAHVTLLRKLVNDKEVEVNTVDQYQGRDKDVILYTCARSVLHQKKEHEILDDQRRLTVAITRAKHKLIIIADEATVMKYMPFKNLFEVIDDKNVIRLRDGEEEFDWKNLVRSVL
ncbi:DNA replication ATP-dependent helicase/nuclease DNA2 isoform X2 [Harpegnathos saltator]|uniref:DNA replication ATP-dependent helicase/nuclease DNA2 isoform X2 n=1 Tax=Harpegnathos saltator TaxID=610380 RepID=UPI00058C0F07|nr:DNA replication ATP-dependent helicase/nuclease DNA2 isoform X2 [Harpegnathos saltator]